MRISPVYTEKSLSNAKEGKYTFWAERNMTKTDIKKEAENLFGVHVVSIRTINYKGGDKRNMRGIKQKIKARKKAFLTLRAKEKIDLFEEKGEKNK